MKVIFNSDLLYATQLIQNELPKKLIEFLNECKKYNHHILIPQTTLFEFNNKQKGFLEKEIIEIQNAINKLSRYDNTNTYQEPSSLVKAPDLLKLIQALGIECTLEYPSMNDYENAHRKACLREKPHPPEIKSDEMRDLVIWEISLRIAKNNNGAILMSRDVVHTHHRGDEEAKEHHLIRCNSFERGYESLSIETFSAKKIKNLINNILDRIIQSELPIVSGGHVISIKNPIFIDTNEGSSVVTYEVQFETGDGRQMTSSSKMEYVDSLPFLLEFKDIVVINGKDKSNKLANFKLELERPELSADNFTTQVKNLKELIKG